MSHSLRNTQAMLRGLEFCFADLCHAVVKSLSIFNIPSFEIFKFFIIFEISDIKILSTGQNWSYFGHLFVKKDPLSNASIFRQNSM